MARRKAFRPVIERTPTGYVVNLDREEVDLIVRLLAEMRELIMANDPQHDALMRRLFPPAYHLADDAEAEAEYQRLMRDDLVASRLASINQAETLLAGRAPMNDEAMQSFLQSLNGVRLVLGTLLDVGETEDAEGIADDDPMVGEYHLYHFFSYLLEASLQALSE
ncbi:MAG: DUF2017 family protein [Actinomycetota bacterium]|nr:DUF2017 family protein [Actinomycetota bacterium]